MHTLKWRKRFTTTNVASLCFIAATCYLLLGYAHTKKSEKLNKWAETACNRSVPPGIPRTMWVAFGTDLENLQYAANAPLTAYIWKHKLKINPIVFIVHRHSKLSPQARQILDWTRKAGAVVELVQPRDTDALQTFAQIVRIGTFSLPYVDIDDYVVMTDADIWPMSQSYWATAFNHSAHISILNGEFFEQNMNSDIGIAMCYVGARAGVWATLIQESAHAFRFHPTALHRAARSDDINPVRLAADIIDTGRLYHREKWIANDSLVKGGVQWFWDQVYLTHAFRHATQKCQFSYSLGRGLRAGRLDRSDWQYKGYIEQHTDAHLIFPLTSSDVWPKILEVWKDMFGDTRWPNEFYTTLIQSMNASSVD